MAKLVTVVFTLLYYFECGTAGRTTPRYTALYNSSDLSYLSNGIQFPAPKSEEMDPVFEEILQEDLPRMDWMAQLYNHHKWEQHLKVLTNSRCRDDMLSYLVALKNGTSWAAKSQLSETFSSFCYIIQRIA